jgi:hypothetical protein
MQCTEGICSAGLDERTDMIVAKSDKGLDPPQSCSREAGQVLVAQQQALVTKLAHERANQSNRYPEQGCFRNWLRGSIEGPRHASGITDQMDDGQTDLW